MPMRCYGHDHCMYMCYDDFLVHNEDLCCCTLFLSPLDFASEVQHFLEIHSIPHIGSQFFFTIPLDVAVLPNLLSGLFDCAHK